MEETFSHKSTISRHMSLSSLAANSSTSCFASHVDPLQRGMSTSEYTIEIEYEPTQFIIRTMEEVFRVSTRKRSHYWSYVPSERKRLIGGDLLAHDIICHRFFEYWPQGTLICEENSSCQREHSRGKEAHGISDPCDGSKSAAANGPRRSPAMIQMMIVREDIIVAMGVGDYWNCRIYFADESGLVMKDSHGKSSFPPTPSSSSKPIKMRVASASVGSLERKVRMLAYHPIFAQIGDVRNYLAFYEGTIDAVFEPIPVRIWELVGMFLAKHAGFHVSTLNRTPLRLDFAACQTAVATASGDCLDAVLSAFGQKVSRRGDFLLESLSQ